MCYLAGKYFELFAGGLLVWHRAELYLWLLEVVVVVVVAAAVVVAPNSVSAVANPLSAALRDKRRLGAVPDILQMWPLSAVPD